MSEQQTASRGYDTFSAWKAAVLAALISLLALLGLGLRRDSTVLPSALVGRDLPKFRLERLGGGAPLQSDEFLGKPLIINFWASWCGACRTEHGELVELGRQLDKSGKAAIIGINFRDTEQGADRFLSDKGRLPYPSGVDPDGRTGIDFGVYGLPETFFVRADGSIAARHVGALSSEQATKYLEQLGVAR